MTPVGKDAAGEFRAAPGAAAIVDGEHHKAMGREQLSLERWPVALQLEGVVVLAVGSAVDPHDRRIATSGNVVGWLDELSVHDRAVAAPEGDVLDRSQLQLPEQRLVVSAQGPQLPR